MYYVIRSNIEKICFDLRLSKSALSEILGVSRQTIYDWLSGKNESFKSENMLKIEWLSNLAEKLDQNVRGSLWLWKDKKLSNGLTVKESLGKTDISFQNLAMEINSALGKGKDAPRLISKNQEVARRPLVDKSAPFTNNE